MRLLKSWLPALVFAAVILSAANDQFSATNTGGWFKRVLGFELPYVLHVLVRKLAHLTEYALLAALAWRADKRWFVPMAFAALVAIADESLQAMTATRTGSPLDVLVDVLGAAIAVLVLRRWRR